MALSAPPSTQQHTQQGARRRAPVPLLLESFPAPPSHIPPSPSVAPALSPAGLFPAAHPLPSPAGLAPHLAPNPPPTGPPTSPLPPIPGPSRISETEQLLLLASASRLSTASTGSVGRPSLIIPSSSSISSTSPPHVSPSSTSTSSPPRRRNPPHLQNQHPQHLHQTQHPQYQHLHQPLLTQTRLSPMPSSASLSSDIDIDAGESDLDYIAYGAASSYSRHGHGHGYGNGYGNGHAGHAANESIASIDVRAILGAVSAFSAGSGEGSEYDDDGSSFYARDVLHPSQAPGVSNSTQYPNIHPHLRQRENPPSNPPTTTNVSARSVPYALPQPHLPPSSRNATPSTSTSTRLERQEQRHDVGYHPSSLSGHPSPPSHISTTSHPSATSHPSPSSAAQQQLHQQLPPPANPNPARGFKSFVFPAPATSTLASASSSSFTASTADTAPAGDYTPTQSTSSFNANTTANTSRKTHMRGGPSNSNGSGSGSGSGSFSYPTRSKLSAVNAWPGVSGEVLGGMQEKERERGITQQQHQQGSTSNSTPHPGSNSHSNSGSGSLSKSTPASMYTTTSTPASTSYTTHMRTPSKPGTPYAPAMVFSAGVLASSSSVHVASGSGSGVNEKGLGMGMEEEIRGTRPLRVAGKWFGSNEDDKEGKEKEDDTKKTGKTGRIVSSASTLTNYSAFSRGEDVGMHPDGLDGLNGLDDGVEGGNEEAYAYEGRYEFGAFGEGASLLDVRVGGVNGVGGGVGGVNGVEDGADEEEIGEEERQRARAHFRALSLSRSASGRPLSMSKSTPTTSSTPMSMSRSTSTATATSASMSTPTSATTGTTSATGIASTSTSTTTSTSASTSNSNSTSTASTSTASTPIPTPSTAPTASQTIKDLRAELRAGRTRSPALRAVYGMRSGAGAGASSGSSGSPTSPASPASPPVEKEGTTSAGLGLGPPPRKEKDADAVSMMSVTPGGDESEEEQEPLVRMSAPMPVDFAVQVRRVVRVEGGVVNEGEGDIGGDRTEMTLDELGGAGRRNEAPKGKSAKTTQSAKATTTTPEDDRAPSPDIATILSLSSSARARSRSRPRPRAGQPKRVVSDGGIGLGLHGLSASAPAQGQGRRQSDGARAVSGPGPLDPAGPWEHRAAASSQQQPQERGKIQRRKLYPEAEDDAGGEHDERLERALEGGASEEEEGVDELGFRVGPGSGGGAVRRGRQRTVRRREDEGDSDSSLDLHTPLPHLMVRHGLLSPNSKLLPGAASRAGTPGQDGRPGSMMSLRSNASVVTKEGIIKDERDTPMRRVRHRDGKMLRGGIGLTTGLGWSDSEDEDAPSPLTRRLSTLNLSRRSSASALVTPNTAHTLSSAARRLHQHPLARSFSHGALLDSERQRYSNGDLDEEDEDDYGVTDNAPRNRRPSGGSSKSGHGQKPKTAPPTAWLARSTGADGSTSGHGHGSGPGQRRSAGSRTSASSVGSGFSLEVTIPDDDRSKTPSKMRRPSASTVNSMTTPSTRSSGAGYGYGYGRDSTGSTTYTARSPIRQASRDELNTPSSTASTLSIPMPATPRDDADSIAPPTPTPGKKRQFDKDKSLPPLPAGGLKKTSASSSRTDVASVASSTATATPRYAFPRARTFSSTSSAASAHNTTSAAAAPSPSSTTPAISPLVRPLQLPRQAARTSGDRAAVPVPSVLSHSTSRPSLRTPSSSSLHLSGPTSPSLSTSTPSTPNTPNTGIARPKPRTGTGMVYRTSSSVGSKMRAPMPLSSSTSALVGGNSMSTGPATRSIGRVGGMPRVAAPF